MQYSQSVNLFRVCLSSTEKDTPGILIKSKWPAVILMEISYTTET
jgi:hypothetical protein